MFCSVCGRLRLNSNCSSGAWMSCDHQSEILVLLGSSFSWNWWFLGEDIQNLFFICFCAEAWKGKNLLQVTNSWQEELGTAEANFLKVWEFWLLTSTKQSCGGPSNCHDSPSRWLSSRDHWQLNTHTHKATATNSRTGRISGISGEFCEELAKSVFFKWRSTYCDAKQDETRAMDFPSATRINITVLFLKHSFSASHGLTRSKSKFAAWETFQIWRQNGTAGKSGIWLHQIQHKCGLSLRRKENSIRTNCL